MNIIIPESHNELLAAEWQVTFTKPIQHGSAIYQQREYSKQIPCLESVARVTICCTVLLLCCPLFPYIFGTSNSKYLNGPRCGKDLLVCHVLDEKATQELENADATVLGFSPQDPTSMKRYMEEHPELVKTYTHHQYLLYRT